MVPSGQRHSQAPGVLAHTLPEGQVKVPRVHSLTSAQLPPRASKPGSQEQSALSAEAQTAPHWSWKELEQPQLPLVQVAPPRQSELEKQPEVQRRVSGLQPKSPGQGMVVQSLGSGRHTPRLHTTPASQAWPQLPQLFSSVVRSRQLAPQAVVAPAQREPGALLGCPPSKVAPPSGRAAGTRTATQDAAAPQVVPVGHAVHCAPKMPQAWSMRPSWHWPEASQQPWQLSGAQAEVDESGPPQAAKRTAAKKQGNRVRSAGMTGGWGARDALLRKRTRRPVA